MRRDQIVDEIASKLYMSPMFKRFPPFLFKVFRALTLYNLCNFKSATSELLIQLVDTTSDSSIQSYDRALRFYSDKLDQTWDR